MYKVVQYNDFYWDIVDIETGEVVVRDTWIGISVIRKWFDC